MKEIVKKTVLVFCCFYTLLTIVSSVINLLIGRKSDTFVHLLDRAAVILIPILFYFIVKKLRCGIRMKFLIHYISTMLLTMLETFVFGLITKELASSAYRDQFLNYTLGYLIAMILFGIREYLKEKRNGKICL